MTATSRDRPSSSAHPDQHLPGPPDAVAELFPGPDGGLLGPRVHAVHQVQEVRHLGIDLFAAPVEVYQNAVYLHQSAQYTIERLDLDDRKAYARPVEVDYYTDAQIKADLKVLDTFRDEAVGNVTKNCGEVSVTWLPSIYKKIKFGTHENVGWGDISLPETTMHTSSYWLEFPEDVPERFGLSQKELSEARAQYGPYHKNIVEALVKVASAYRAQGRFADAETYLKKALAMRTLLVGEQVKKEDYADVYIGLRNLYELYKAENKMSEAAIALQRAIEVFPQPLVRFVLSIRHSSCRRRLARVKILLLFASPVAGETPATHFQRLL